jgi:phospholipid-binding lipoprotein MlaA
MRILIFIMIISGGLGGCATTKEPSAPVADNNSIDPYENVNRKIYAFNDAIDDYIAKPVSDTYQEYTPKIMQTGVTNFFNNLNDINVVFNDLLQGKFAQGSQDTRRFIMNTTLGMAGFFDVATTVGLTQNEEDFEQTLAVWGVPQGKYLVLPFLGPITYRGIPGAVFDTAANPVTYTGAPLLSNFIGGPIQAVSLIDKRAKAEGSLKFINEAALDPYLFMRESFLQWRRHLATDGKVESEDLLDEDEGVQDNK